jgi:hypothetical protein
MSDLELIQLYQDLTASGETLARSVTMFVQSLPFIGPDDPALPPNVPTETVLSPESSIEPPPGAED